MPDHDLLPLDVTKTAPCNRHALLILAHDQPCHLSRLVSRLQHPRLDIYIHLDRKHLQRFNRAKLEKEGAQVISTRRLNWGGLSSSEAQLDLLKHSRSDRTHQTYSLISGQDYPLCRVEDLALELDSTKGSLIDHWHDEDPCWHSRYHRPYFYDFPYSRILNAASRRLARFLPNRKPPKGIKIYFGWAWWTLDNKAIDAILEFYENRPEVVQWFRYMHIADESFFHTALMNSGHSLNLSRAVRRYIKFPNASTHPKVIDQTDLEEALGGDFWFGRKFDPDTNPDCLDEIDRRLRFSRKESK